MTTNTINTTLFLAIASLHSDVTRVAFRALANGCTSRLIGAARSELRRQRQLQRQGDDVDSLDERNAQDEAERGKLVEALQRDLQGFDATTIAPIELANTLMTVRQYAHQRLMDVADSPFDNPMGSEEMIDFMIAKARPADPKRLLQLAEVLKVDVKYLQQIDIARDLSDRKQLEDSKDEILQIIRSVHSVPNEDPEIAAQDAEKAFDALPVAIQLSLAEKVKTGINRRREQLIGNMLRGGNSDQLGTISLLGTGSDVVQAWTDSFVKRHSKELEQAAQRGELAAPTRKTVDFV